MLGAHRRLLQDMVTNESALMLQPDRLHAFPPENEGAVDGPLESIMQSDLAVGAAMRGKQIGLTTITDPAVRGHALMVVCEDGDRQPVFLVVHYCSTASAPSQAAAELPCGSVILVKEPRLRAFPSLGPVVCCSNPANVFFPSLPLPEPSPMVDSVDQLLSDARYRDAARELMARKELARMRAVLQVRVSSVLLSSVSLLVGQATDAWMSGACIAMFVCSGRESSRRGGMISLTFIRLTLRMNGQCVPTTRVHASRCD